MDRIESLSNTLSQITFYDIKSMYNQAKNVVLNVSETEAKVREATNDEPWGASSTLMQEIAQGTFNFQQFNEIMPCIYGRFMEKEARQWRQIYKALQLLEYLIKHGSERVVDDARSHISTLKMLRSFHYIDEKGKDEGLNVRNRAKELVEMLSDVEKIRAERRKAKVNRGKYVGTGNDAFGSGMSFGSGGSRYGGFGSETLGGSSYSNDYYGGGGGGGSSSSSRPGGFTDSGNRRGYEEYNAGDDEVLSNSSNRSNTTTRAPTRKASVPTPAPAPAPAPVTNLLEFDDDVSAETIPPATGMATNKALPAVSKPVGLDDDDFDDFQAAPVQSPSMTAAPVPVSTTTIPAVKPNLTGLSGFGGATPASPTGGSIQPQQQKNAFGGLSGMGGGHRSSPSLGGMSQQQQSLFGGAPIRPTAVGPSLMSPMRANTTSPTSPPAVGGGQKKTAGANFDDLWNLSLASTSGTSGQSAPGGPGKSMKDLEKEKAMTGLWGSGGGQKPGVKSPAGNLGGAGFGNFGATSGGAGGGGDDDLLL